MNSAKLGDRPKVGGRFAPEISPVQYLTMRLDHISYACTSAELADVVQRIGGDLGAAFTDGGRHPGFGTRNFILPLAGGIYMEVVTALDHPAAEKAPFGRAVARCANDGGGWLGWVVAVDDIGPIESRIGRASIEGKRVRPDGTELHWRQLGFLDVLDDPQLPFFVSWESGPQCHPSNGGTVAVQKIEICGSREDICNYLGEAPENPLDGVELEWVDADEPGIVAVWFGTAHGSVRID